MWVFGLAVEVSADFDDRDGLTRKKAEMIPQPTAAAPSLPISSVLGDFGLGQSRTR